MQTPPNVFEYLDILIFLKETYKFRKHHIPGFSYEAWAAQMGLRSRSYLRAIIIGEKPAQESLLPHLLAGFDFSDAETGYFILLLRAHIAPTEKLKTIYKRDLFAAWKQRLNQVQVVSLEEFLGDSVAPALFTYLSFEDCSANIELMAKEFKCTAEQIQKTLRHLMMAGLVEAIVSTEGQVAYKTVVPYFKVPSLPGNASLKQFHVEGLRLSQAAADLPSRLRKLYSTFIALDEEQFNKVQLLIEDFNNKLLEVTSDRVLKTKKIYRFNQQLFPLSDIEA